MWAVVWSAIGIGWLVLAVRLVRRRPRRDPVQSITIDEKRRREFSDGERH